MIINYSVIKQSTLREYLESFYLAKSKIYKLFMDKLVMVNNEFKKETDIVNPGDMISITYNEEIDYKPSKKSPDILYEDDYLLVVNKPCGVLIHNEKDNDDSLSNMVAKYYFDNGINLNVRFAHRIDYETTGIVIYAKDILTLSYLSHYIETHDIRREYFLIASGKFKNKKGYIDSPIGRDRHDSQKMRISSTGKDAKTYYEVLKEYKGYTSLKCVLETGRTHQIRVHMESLNHPLLGDRLYGGDTKLISRVALHSHKVSFIHPVTGCKLDVIAPIPMDMEKIL